jgi:hypothetical protein
MAAYARHHLLTFGNYTLHNLVYPSLEKMGSDKKNKRIESAREIRDSDSGSSLEAYIEGIFVSSMEQMGIFGVHESSLIEQIA